MKKILYILVIAALAASCHFGKDESKESLNRSKEYSKKRAEGAQSPMVDDEYLKGTGSADTTATTAETNK